MSDEKSAYQKLHPKHRKFVDSYLGHLNATRSPRPLRPSVRGHVPPEEVASRVTMELLPGWLLDSDYDVKAIGSGLILYKSVGVTDDASGEFAIDTGACPSSPIFYFGFSKGLKDGGQMPLMLVEIFLDDQVNNQSGKKISFHPKPNGYLFGSVAAFTDWVRSQKEK